MSDHPHAFRNELNHTPSASSGKPTAPVGIRRSTIGTLRLRTGVKAGYSNYLGNNPGNQGRDHGGNP